MTMVSETEARFVTIMGKKVNGIFVSGGTETNEKHCLVTEKRREVYIQIGDRYLHLSPEQFTLTAEWANLPQQAVRTRIDGNGAIREILLFPTRMESPVEAIRFTFTSGRKLMIRVCGGKIAMLCTQ